MDLPVAMEPVRPMRSMVGWLVAEVWGFVCGGDVGDGRLKWWLEHVHGSDLQTGG